MAEGLAAYTAWPLRSYPCLLLSSQGPKAGRVPQHSSKGTGVYGVWGLIIFESCPLYACSFVEAQHEGFSGGFPGSPGEAIR